MALKTTITDRNTSGAKTLLSTMTRWNPDKIHYLTRSLLTRLFSVIKVGATALHSARSPIAMGRASKVRMLRISDIDFDRSQHPR